MATLLQNSENWFEKGDIISARVITRKGADELATLTSNLVKIRSWTYDNDGLNEAARHIARYLEDISPLVKVNTLQKRVRRTVEKEGNLVEEEGVYPRVIAEVGDGPLTVLLTGHMDVVEAKYTNDWSKDPFSGDIQNGNVYGRGTTDMKSGLAVLMSVFSSLAGNIDYKLILAATSDEEVGGFNGAKYLAEDHHPDLVLVAEPTTGLAELGEKGVLQIKITINGRATHSSRASLGENAIMYAAEVLVKLRSEIPSIHIEPPTGIKNAMRNGINFLSKFGSNDLGIISFNPARITGGSPRLLNAVPDQCTIEMDLRLPPGISNADAFKMIDDILAKTGISSDPNKIPNMKVERGAHSEPNFTPEDNIYTKLFITALNTHQAESFFTVSTGASDGRFFRDKGIPTIVYGPGQLSDAHTVNESVEISQIETAYNVYMDFLESLSSSKR